MPRCWRTAYAWPLALALAACGGGDAPHGSLLDSPVLLHTLSKAQLDGGPLAPLSGKAKCDVKVISLNYVTPGAKGEQSNASGVLLLPSGADCTAAAPLVAYAKGTDVQKPRTLANPADGETFLLAAMYAGQGYAVVATDYLGFAKSNYSYHPYLHADSEATSVIDSIRAARIAAPLQGGKLNGKVMLTGYSQGGHASMAAHRAIEKSLSSEINVVAGAHLAGPYNMSGSMKIPDAIAGYQFFVPYLVTAWQKIYGNLYSNVSDAFKAPYADGIESLLPSATLNYTTLVTSGKLPGINGETPNQARDALFQTSFSSDILTNPNNPTGRLIEPTRLLDWHDELAERGGWLVVDEAFMDNTPHLSLAAFANQVGLIVLRSFGKFFGLAGVRLGFVLAERKLLKLLAEQVGPWAVSGPTRVLGQVCLRDTDGHQQQRRRSEAASLRLIELLERHGFKPHGGCALFQWLITERAEHLYEFMARQGILLRLFSHNSSVRFGLPADENDWLRLERAFVAYAKEAS